MGGLIFDWRSWRGDVACNAVLVSYDTPLLMLSIIPLLARSWRHGGTGLN